MEKYKIKRINELAKKSKTIGLNSKEKKEQQELRQEYIKNFRNSMKSTLDSIILVDKNGNKTPLKKKN